MAVPVTMPKLGLSMTEGTVVEWRAGPGDAVAKGELLLVVESEKAQVEIEAFASGTLAAVYVGPGKRVPVGTRLGALAEPGEAFERDAFAAGFVPEAGAAPAAAAAATPRTLARPGPEPAGLKVAPAARALARRLGIDLATV